MATARQTGAKIIGVMETDERHNTPDFVQEKTRARTGGRGGVAVHEHVEDNLKLLDDVCFIPLRRQQHEMPAMLGEILRQAQPGPQGPEVTLKPGPLPQPQPQPQPQVPEGIPMVSEARPDGGGLHVEDDV